MNRLFEEKSGHEKGFVRRTGTMPLVVSKLQENSFMQNSTSVQFAKTSVSAPKRCHLLRPRHLRSMIVAEKKRLTNYVYTRSTSLVIAIGWIQNLRNQSNLFEQL